MGSEDRIRSALSAALHDGASGLAAANRLCEACVELLDLDGAAISLIDGGASRGTFGSSGELSRQLDEFQFTFGEGPCLDAVALRRPVLVADLRAAQPQRWPAFSGKVLEAGIRGVFALPVEVGSRPVGALDLFRIEARPLTRDDLSSVLWAAELAGGPLTYLMRADVEELARVDADNSWDELASLQRVEVYQATGMLIIQLDVDAAEALVRLRAYAFANNMTASEVARAIIERRLVFDVDDRSGSTPNGRSS
jgi:hypothetical protein